MKKSMELRWNVTDSGRKAYWEKNLSYSATMSTTKLSWTDLGRNASIRGERQAINRLSQGTTLENEFWHKLRLTIQSVPRSEHTPSWL
jgi:hypothetical protein